MDCVVAFPRVNVFLLCLLNKIVLRCPLYASGYNLFKSKTTEMHLYKIIFIIELKEMSTWLEIISYIFS